VFPDSGPPGSGRPPAQGGRTLHEAATVNGANRWLEMRVFEIVGGWVSTVPEVDVKLALATQGYHHAWHAELWEDRLPVLAGINTDELTAPASEGWERLIAILAEPETPTIERLAGLYRVVLPHKISAYRAQRAATDVLAEGATTRALDLVLADEIADWQEGEALLQSRLSSAAEVARAAQHQARLESLLIIGVERPGAGH
jgi:hypothetical protein